MMLAKAGTLNIASFPSHLRSESKTSKMDRAESVTPPVKIETRQAVKSDESAPSSNPCSNNAVADVNSSMDSCKTSQIEAIRIMQLYLKPAPRSSSIDSLFTSGPATPTASLPSATITKKPTNQPKVENSMFATAELLKQHLTSNNADDQLLHQILFSTMDRSKSTSSSTDIKQSAEPFKGANLSAASQTDAELTVDEVIAQKKSRLDSLQQQIARSSCNEMDCNLFSSTAWKPLLQPNHQDIDYSTSIFASAFASTAGPVDPTEHCRPTTVVTNTETIVLPPATSAAETLLIAAELAEVATNAAASESKSTRILRRSPQRNLIRGHEQSDQSMMNITKPAASVPATTQETPTTDDVSLIEDSEITKHDVLLGRGGRTNHHEGNKKYLQYKLLLQAQYFRANKEGKTRISQQLVQMVHDRKGRFLKQAEPDMIKRAYGVVRSRKKGDDDDDNQLWYEVDVLTARKKASQTLREQSTPEFRAAKRAKYSR